MPTNSTPTSSSSDISEPLHTAWLARLEGLIDGGVQTAPRGLQTYEQLDQRLVVDSRRNLLDVPTRGLNYRFAVAEWLWMAFGRNDVATLKQYNSVMSRFSDDGVTLTGAYGPHIVKQRPFVLEALRRDPLTRQAVIEIQRPRVPTRDEPCTLSLQFLQRDGVLHCFATMRSSDAWLGIPYDVFSFTQLQNSIAGELHLQRGRLSLRMSSSHLYAHDLPAVHTVLNAPNHATLESPDLPGWPPAWLEDVLVNRSLHKAWLEEPWATYAYALLSKTSTEAHKILGGLT